MFLTFWLLKEGFVFSQGSRLISFDEMQIHSSKPMSAIIENFCKPWTIPPKKFPFVGTYNFCFNFKIIIFLHLLARKPWINLWQMSNDWLRLPHTCNIFAYLQYSNSDYGIICCKGLACNLDTLRWWRWWWILNEWWRSFFFGQVW